MAEIHSIKNQDYANSESDPFRNFKMSELVGVSPWRGCLIRLGDKFIRINNLANKENPAVKTESIQDTLMDLSIYALITRILYEEEMSQMSGNPFYQ